MDKYKIAKQAVTLVVGAGVSHIVSGVVNSLVPQETVYQKTITTAGRIGIGLLVSAAVEDHVDKKMDETRDWFLKAKKDWNEA